MDFNDFKAGLVVRGAIFPEPVKIITTVAVGDSLKLIGEGTISGKVHQPILTGGRSRRPASLPGRATLRRRRRQVPARHRGPAARAGLRVRPVLLASRSPASIRCRTSSRRSTTTSCKLPRIRFLLADDPGAGKTIMAGLLLKELKIRGLVKRTLIVTPANLTFQWQREMKDKFREKFEVIRGDVLRANYGAEPLAGAGPGRHLGLLGLAHRGRQGKPAAQPAGTSSSSTRPTR